MFSCKSQKAYGSILTVLLVLSMAFTLSAATIKGTVKSGTESIPLANVYLKGTDWGTTTDLDGKYELRNIPAGEYTLIVSFISFKPVKQSIKLTKDQVLIKDVELESDERVLEELVITGTMKPVSKSESPVPVEVYSPAFFKTNPTPSIYEAMQNVNGVRPQVNCAVCNTGDIHINGLEGAYSMVMIDGMPIVSGLSTVYGLSGIPQSLIERVEIVKGPASTLYGSEAVGGLINVITVKPQNAPLFFGDVFATGWGEVNTDIGAKFKAGQKASALVGVNYFNFQNRVDHNNDNFTDLTLQDRISIFNKWNFERKNGKVFSLAGRYVYEDRFGGELNWAPEHRGGSDVYGESIYTSRWELFGTYQLPIEKDISLMFSVNQHHQNSVYGDMWYIADQRIGFGQLVWNEEVGERHDFLLGAAMRYTYYDDNTTATEHADATHPVNAPTSTYLPGVFLQDEIDLNATNKLLMGMRYDHNSLHGHILTPRLNYKLSSKDKKDVLRFSFGTGYRVANVFTEDHAALTGSRDVVFLSDLNPETSYNGNINYVKKMYAKNGLYVGIDASAFYTYFNNKIFADYDTDVTKIIYDNLSGHAVSNGVSVNFDVTFDNFKLLAGATLMEVYSMENGVKARQELTEKFTATWSMGYEFESIGLTVDYTGNLYSPMDLPTLGELDPRPTESPWWSIQNIQLTKPIGKRWELYGGVKNLLNWTPWKGMESDMIARSFDPFDKNVEFDANGQAMPTATNPYGLTFDPAYVYGPNQGIRGFFGFRYTLDR